MIPRRLAAAACSLLFASLVRAQPPSSNQRALVVIVEADAVTIAPPEAVRAALAAELHAPVAPAAPPGARGTLIIRAAADHRLVLTYRAAAGSEIQRTVALPSDPAATVEMIVLL